MTIRFYKKDKLEGFEKSDLRLLYEYASQCNFIIETGSGISTKYLAAASLKNNAKFVSIEIRKDRQILLRNTEHILGWSITKEDLIRYNKKEIIEQVINKYGKKYNRRFGTTKGPLKEMFTILGMKDYMNEEFDLIRKTLEKYKELELDFFFCDSGEYCGLPEWNIVKDKIRVGGYFAGHDIDPSKSYKNYEVSKEIERDKKWKIIEKTKTLQGLIIAQKISKE